MADKFILVSLDDTKAKKLAEIISNDTARRILDFLSEKAEATSSEISKHLKLPLNTIHYNMKNLIENELVQSKEFKWSQKGREMDIYKLANKHIIISTKKSSLIAEKLKEVFIIFLIGGGIAGLIQYLSITESIDISVEKSAMIAEAITAPSRAASQITSNIAVWFLLGIIVACLAYLIISRRKK